MWILSSDFYSTYNLNIFKHLRLWPNDERDLFPFSAPGFKLYCARLSPPRCLTCLLGLQDVQWARWLVVVRLSWPGHRGLPKYTHTHLTVHVFHPAMPYMFTELAGCSVDLRISYDDTVLPKKYIYKSSTQQVLINYI